jgi:HlyD family secretion protein
VNFRRVVFLLLAAIAVGAGVYYARGTGPDDVVLTGIVTTEDVMVSPQVAGRIDTLTVDAGDSVSEGQLIAVIAPAELEADRAFYAHSADALGAQVTANEADVAAAEAEVSEAQASLAKAKQTYERSRSVARSGGVTPEDLDQAHTAVEVAQAQTDAAQKRVVAAKSALAASIQQRDAAAAQVAKARVRLGYTEVRAPIKGIVDVRAVRVGEVVTAGEPIVTLVDPDDLWVRADVEESYIDRIRLGDTLTVRLPSGAERKGTVFYRGVDADYATQRDVSRTKRDIKTFQIRLHVDNSDRRLALGETAYVLLPPQQVGS